MIGTPTLVGTAERQVRRFRGDNNEMNFDVGPSGRLVGGMGGGFAPSSGFTIDKVEGGYYTPYTGVNNGFAIPEKVHSGYYIAGWGVVSNLGDFRGLPTAEQLHGGMFIPGFGVSGFGMGTPGINSGAVDTTNVQRTADSVQGGTYTPGFGVPGFGVVGSH